MIRRLVDWFLYALRIKKRDKRSGIQALMDLAPLLFATFTIMVIVAPFAEEYREWLEKLPWYRKYPIKIKQKIKHNLAILRREVIGY